jgi:hypothetical protein
MSKRTQHHPEAKAKKCALLSSSRSSFYYEPKGESEMNLDLPCGSLQT